MSEIDSTPPWDEPEATGGGELPEVPEPRKPEPAPDLAPVRHAYQMSVKDAVPYIRHTLTATDLRKELELEQAHSNRKTVVSACLDQIQGLGLEVGPPTDITEERPKPTKTPKKRRGKAKVAFTVVLRTTSGTMIRAPYATEKGVQSLVIRITRGARNPNKAPVVIDEAGLQHVIYALDYLSIEGGPVDLGKIF